MVGLKVESMFVISAVIAMGTAIYLATVSHYLGDLGHRTIVLIVATSLLIAGISFSVGYFFYSALSNQVAR